MSLEKLLAFNKELIELCEKHDVGIMAKGELLALTNDDGCIYRIGCFYDGLDLQMDMTVALEEYGEIPVWGYGPYSPFHPENQKEN